MTGPRPRPGEAAPSVPILILAAGLSRRMAGRDKLMEEVGGRPLLRLVAERALATGHPVVIALPPGATPRRAALAGLQVTTVEILAAVPGMGHSIAAGIAALPQDAAAVLILLADMPEITTADIEAVIAAGPDQAARGADGDRPGHPVLLPARFLDRLAALSGDDGARQVLSEAAPRLIALPAGHARTDLDTPEAWAAWRAGRDPD